MREFDELKSEDVVVSLASIQYRNRDLYRNLMKTRARIGVVRLGAIPSARSFRSYAQRFFRQPSRGVEFFLGRLPGAWSGIRPLDFILKGGSFPISNPLTAPETKIIDAHALDYDLVLANQSAAPFDSENFAVFVDEGGPLAPDYIEQNWGFPLKPDEYYSLMNRFFDSLEKRFDCEIQIALHPRTCYEDQQKYYEGRKVIQGKTALLIRDARFVVVHGSTAINFATVYRKPLIFASYDYQKKTYFGLLIDAWAATLNKSPVDLHADADVDWEKHLIVDEAAYSKYVETYIKNSGSPDKPCWDIFADYILRSGGRA